MFRITVQMVGYKCRLLVVRPQQCQRLCANLMILVLCADGLFGPLTMLLDPCRVCCLPCHPCACSLNGLSLNSWRVRYFIHNLFKLSHMFLFHIASKQYLYHACVNITILSRRAPMCMQATQAFKLEAVHSTWKTADCRRHGDSFLGVRLSRKSVPEACLCAAMLRASARGRRASSNPTGDFFSFWPQKLSFLFLFYAE